MANISIVDNIILGCLSTRPMSGYEIKQIISNSTALFYNASYGSIYPILKKHEENGLVSAQEVTENGRYKKIYALTDAGRREFMEWLMSDPSADPGPVTIKYEMLVRLFFFHNLGREEMTAQVTLHLQQLKDARTALGSIEKIARGEGDAYQMLTLQWGTDFYNFSIQWYEKLLEQLTGSTNTTRPLPCSK